MYSSTTLGVTSPFFPGILLSRNDQKPWGNGWFLKRTMAEKNGRGINPQNNALFAAPEPAAPNQPGNFTIWRQRGSVRNTRRRAERLSGPKSEGSYFKRLHSGVAFSTEMSTTRGAAYVSHKTVEKANHGSTLKLCK